MALKGNLQDFSTTQLLNLVHLAQKTGKLHVKGQGQKITLFFKEGRLIQASSSMAEDHLAALLLKRGRLTPEQAEALTRRIGTSDRSLGQFLMDARLMSKADIAQSVKDYMLEIVYNLFSWAEGEFCFEPDSLPASHRITVPLHLDKVILDYSRRTQESDRLLAELPDLGAIRLKITDKPLYHIRLTPDDWRVITHIHPHHTVEQIAQESNMDELQIRKVVYGLLQVGLVEAIQPARPEQKPAKTSPAGPSLANNRRVIMKIIDRLSLSMNSVRARVAQA